MDISFDYRNLVLVRLIAIIFILFIGLNLNAQDNGNDNSLEGVPFGERLYFGGDFNMGFGNITLININPLVGYRITKPWSVGMAAKYLYYRERWPQYNYTWSTSIYGGSMFTRRLLGDFAFAHAEFEYLNTDVFNIVTATSERGWVPVGFVGGGYRQGVGRSYFQLMLLYDLIDDRNSPYRGQYLWQGVPLIYRAGIIIGL